MARYRSVTVNRAETIVQLPLGPAPSLVPSLPEGTRMYDIILEAAREVVKRKGFNRFRGGELYRLALEKYPYLKRNSFMSRMIACAPNHPSYKHFASRRDYFSHIGPGLYWLNDKYMPGKTSDQDILENHRRMSTGQ